MHFRFIRCKSWIISFESHIKLTVHPYVINNGLMSSTNAFRKSSWRAGKNLHLCHLFFRIFIFDTILHSDIRCNTDMKKILRQWLCTIPATGGWSCAHNYIVNIAHIRAHNPCHRCAVCGCCWYILLNCNLVSISCFVWPDLSTAINLCLLT